MKIGLIGFPGSGKTTVFNALTGLSADTGYAAAKGKTNLGVVKVPDLRVDALAQLYKPKKVTYAEITFCDVGVGMGPNEGKKHGVDRTLLSAMRDVDALCHVVHAFAGPEQEVLQPLRDVVDLEADLILADLELVENRLARIQKEKAKPREAELLAVLKTQLDAEKPLRQLSHLSDDEWALFAGFRFLSQKPLLLLYNVDESAVTEPPPLQVAEYAQKNGLGCVVLCAPVEQDIAHMSGEEQTEFTATLGLKETACTRFVQAAFSLLQLISFLTAGPDECRAWPIRVGTTAQKAAGKIHSDLERGFIRAEVVRFEDLVALGSEARCREAGKLRLEGKNYVVKDGDVMQIRFNI